MNLSKLKWKLGFCVKAGCHKRGVNDLNFKGMKNGKPTSINCKVCSEHTDELLVHLKENGIEMTKTYN